MRMKNERCKLRNNNKFNIGFYMFPIMIMLCLTFLQGAYYEKNVYYKLEDITLEIGEKIPKEVYSNLILLNDPNYDIESNISLGDLGKTNKIGKYVYYLVYNDPIAKTSKLTNIKATIEVIDTVKPEIILKEKKEFDYNSKISANDLAECYDLSGCTVTLKDEIDTKSSGEKEITIIATDEGNNKSYMTEKITIKEKPKPVYYFYYPQNMEEINNHNYNKNALLTENEKNNLRNQIANYSKRFIGNPYVYGGTSLTNGTDCSGFTMSIYNSFGYLLPRVATSQIYAGIEVNQNDLLPGDIIVYHYGHVGIYVGNNMMVHASTPKNGITMIPIFGGDKSYRRVIY